MLARYEPPGASRDRKGKSVRRFVALVLGLSVLTGCKDAKEAASAPMRHTDSGSHSQDDRLSNRNANLTLSLPKSALGADRAMMRAWLTQNDLCRGSSDAAMIDTMCPKRDQTEAKLKKRGWCWTYDDWTVVPADYRWHRCTETTLPDTERSVPRSQFEDNITNEVHPTPEPALEFSRVEKAKQTMEPYYAAAIESQVIYYCGFRDADWAGQIATDVRVLHQIITSQFSDTEIKDLVTFQNGMVARMLKVLAPNGTPTTAKCQQLANAGEPEKIDRVAWRLRSEVP